MKNFDLNLYHSHLTYTELLRQTPEWYGQVLGVFCFSASPLWTGHIDAMVPFLQVEMQPLTGASAMCEVWQSHSEVLQGQSHTIQYRYNEHVIFGVIKLAESDFTGTTPLRDATESAYRQIGALLAEMDFPYVFRYWNYMADINGIQDQLERYQQFNLGRQDALLALGGAITGNVPAACALGMPNGPMSIAFLAGRVAQVGIENPRQLSAYDYPPDYGPRSPTFSRATLVRPADADMLFISGTASIVGHASLHTDDVAAQTRETMRNIAAVLTEANRYTKVGRFELTDLLYKVYVRHSADMQSVRSEIEHFVGSPINALYLLADICRHELLVEIEATAPLRHHQSGG